MALPGSKLYHRVRKWVNARKRANAGLTAFQRRKIADELQTGRRLDRRTFRGENIEGYYTNRGPALFQHDFGVELDRELWMGIARLPPGEKLEVLEISAGQGLLLEHMRRELGEHLNVTATGLARPPKVPPGVTYRTGILRQLVPKLAKKKKRFHFIACLEGETQLLTPAATARFLNRLMAPEGRACIQFALRQGETSAALIKPFEELGFRVLSTRYRPRARSDDVVLSLRLARAQ